MESVRAAFRKLSPLERTLVFAALGCVVLLAVRALYARSLEYDFLVWNLFLAGIPLAFARNIARVRGRWQLFLGAAWLLFFPNAPYILTDFIHLGKKGTPDTRWLDALLIAAFAGTGLVAGLESLRLVHKRLLDGLGVRIATLAVIAIGFLSGFGVYLGRFLRWNSWDVLTRPFSLAADIAHRILFPFEHPRTWAFTLISGAFLLSAYLVFLAVRRGASASGREPEMTAAESACADVE